jgi:multidrug efflux pump subunit AcrB
MNLVSFALRRPISLLTMVVAAALLGFLALDRMSRDIFPDLGVPVLYVAQPYGGLDPAQMEGFIVNYYEYHFLYITGIEHVESKSIQGVGLVKLQFHPGTNMAQATAETVAYVDRARAFMPTGTVPPFVVRFDGGSVPVGDLVFSSRASGRGALQGAPIVRDLAGRVGTAALRLEPAHHPRSPGSQQAAFLQHVAGRGGAGVGCRQHGQPIG